MNSLAKPQRAPYSGSLHVDATTLAGGYRITTSGPEFEREMDLARKIMREDRNVLRELARR